MGIYLFLGLLWRTMTSHGKGSTHKGAHSPVRHLLPFSQHLPWSGLYWHIQSPAQVAHHTLIFQQ